MGKTLGIALIVVTMLGRSAVADEHDEQKQWRTAFFASLALTIGTGVFWSVSFASMHSEASAIEATKPSGDVLTQDDCNDRAGIVNDEEGHFDSACAWRSRSRTAMALSVGFGIVTLATAYLAFVDRDDAPRSPGVAVVPTFSADGAGAALRLRW